MKIILKYIFLNKYRKATFFPQSKISCLQKFNFRQTPHYSEMGINNIFIIIVFNLLSFSMWIQQRAAVLQQQCCTGEMRDKLFSIKLPLVSSSWSQLEYSWECAHEDPLFPRIVATSSDYAVIKLTRSARAWRWQCVCRARGLNPFLRAASTDRCDTARS